MNFFKKIIQFSVKATMEKNFTSLSMEKSVSRYLIRHMTLKRKSLTQLRLLSSIYYRISKRYRMNWMKSLRPCKKSLIQLPMTLRILMQKSEKQGFSKTIYRLSLIHYLSLSSFKSFHLENLLERRL
jgi:hypothetical protein